MKDILTGITNTATATIKSFSKVGNQIDLVNVYTKELIDEFKYISKNLISYDEFVISVTGNTGMTLSFPELKYNKDFVFNISSNDGYHGVYNYLQKYVNKKYVETGYTENHDNMVRLSGITSPNILGYTDGLGTQIPFKFCLYYNNISVSGLTTDEYITNNEIQKFIDFNGSIGIDTINYRNDFSGYTKTMNNLTGITNNFNYTPTSTNTDNNISDCYTFNGDNVIIDSSDLKKIKLYKNKTGTTINNTHLYYNEINLDKIGVTNLDSLYLLLDNINTTYGLGGNDTVWGTTADEVFEWLFIKKYSRITKTIISGDTLFTILIPKTPNFKYKSITLVGSVEPTNIKIFGDYTKATYGLNNSIFLINIDYDDKLINKIDKYITLAENNKNSPYYSEYLQDATFFYNMMGDDLKIYNNSIKTRYENL